MKSYYIFVIICSMNFFVACMGSGNNSAKQDSYQSIETGAVSATMPAKLREESGEDMSSNATTASNADGSPVSNLPAPLVVSPKIIKNADISYQVSNYKKARQQIIETVKAFNGRVATENESNNSNTLSNAFVIRIDAARFDSLVTQLMQPATYVQHKQITSDDVTEQYVDIQARLKARKAVEERYTAILKQAKTIKEILEVENQLRLIREDIDAAEGKLRYMNSRVSESTITLSIYEQLPYNRAPEQGFFSRIAEAFATGWHGLLEFIIGLVSAWSFIVLLLFGLFILQRLWKHRRLSNSNKPDKPDKPANINP